MLAQQTLEKLYDLRLKGMAQAFQEQLERGDASQLSFEERLGLLIDREWLLLENRRLHRRLKASKLKTQPCVEDIDYRHPRGLDRKIMQDLVCCRWVRAGRNVILCGPTGVGKTWLASALGHKACRDGFTVYYARVPLFLHELSMARVDGSYIKLLKHLVKFDILILDDLGLCPIEGGAMHSLLDVIDDRTGVKSTIVTSQLPVGKWHAMVGDPSIADALLDRILGGAVQTIQLKGDSMRKAKD